MWFCDDASASTAQWFIEESIIQLFLFILELHTEGRGDNR